MLVLAFPIAHMCSTYKAEVVEDCSLQVYSVQQQLLRVYDI